jgi:GNAT superfamily N-acetyltransferase
MTLQPAEHCVDQLAACTPGTSSPVNGGGGFDEPVEVDPNDSELLHEIGRLRVLAWSSSDRTLVFKTSFWLDDFEMPSRHWCIFHNDEVVAAARMTMTTNLDGVPDAFLYAGVFENPPPGPIASLNRLVVHPRFRGRQLSRLMDAIRLREARIAHCQSVVCETHSGGKRLAQLVEFGFKVVGPANNYPPGHFFERSGVVLFCNLANQSCRARDASDS